MSQIKRRSVKTQFGLLCIVEEAGEITRLDWGIAADDHTDFQRDVCAVMFAIPFGYTRTYGEIAKNLGVPAQAVGQACGGNPIPIIIPCHRVIGANGLTGFSGEGGVETKVALLRHEGAAGLLI
jgi:methylated-DNA-[protein]-cysteine S-methyltransferase